MSKDGLKILGVFKENLFGEFSISEVMKKANKKSKPWVFNTLKKFEKEKFLLSEKKANINLYKANLGNPLLIQSFLFLESQSLVNFKYLGIIIKIIEKIPAENYCLLIFGSYTENKQRNDSDLDICFLVENKESESKIRPYFNEIKLLSEVKIDEHYIPFEDFVGMLLKDEENLGKQMFKRHKTLFNGNIFYKLVLKAHKNGFNG